MTGEIKDPFGAHSFLVEIDGIARAAFQQASGFDSTVEVVEYREGGDNQTTQKLPGRVTYSNIQLKRGVTDDLDLHDWHQKVVAGEDMKNVRRNGSIVLLNRRGDEVARWNFVRAWPTKYDGPDLNAEASEIAVETLELAHEGVSRFK
ncbi:phage tail protein [Thiococcus pfennigii]|uniref:phage tail protein n=1 Tax=Thiococcus pfennigii TaxID=1057 RepID=UPI0019060E6B|nr:phage tail protein [Thiococcus pfennigii]MBK1699388.1 phage tail protein [Thiococcus pfennigii]